MGMARNNSSLYEIALAACDKAIEIDSVHAEAWRIKGKIFYHLGKTNNSIYYERSLESYDIAISINPRSESAWYGKGETLNSLQRPIEAAICRAIGRETELRYGTKGNIYSIPANLFISFIWIWAI